MRKNILVAVLFSAMVFRLPAQEIKMNLNPSFELVLAKSIPLYWKDYSDYSPEKNFKIYTDTLKAKSGKRSICIEGEKLMTVDNPYIQNKGGFLLSDILDISTYFSKLAKDTFIVSLSVYYQMQGDDNCYAMIGYNKRNSSNPFVLLKDTIYNTKAWKKKSVSFKITKNDIWQILFLFNGKGKVWFDDVELTVDGVKVKNIIPEKPTKADIDFVNKNSIKINSSLFNAESKDLDTVLTTIPNDIRIYALGEATHGSSELWSLRARFIKELILKRGLKFVVLETNFAESYTGLNRYLLDGKGNAKQALQNTLVWPWQTMEMAELLDWVKKYNDTALQKVYFLGMDVQFNAYNIKIMKYALQSIDSNLINPILSELNFLGNNPSEKWLTYLDYNWQQHPDSIALFRNYATKVYNYLQINKLKFIDSKGKYKAELLCQIAKNLIYFSEMLESQENRDRLMAENVSWLLSTFDSATIAIIAHEGHITPKYYKENCGKILKEKYGEKYYSLSFTTASGTYSAIRPGIGLINTAELLPRLPNSLENLLQESNYSELYLPLKNNNLPEFLRQTKLEHLAIGSMEDTKNQTILLSSPSGIKDFFDGIFFVKKTKGTKLYFLNENK